MRSYDPSTKKWIVDLLARPILLEHLAEHEYTPCNKLKGIGKSLQELEGFLQDIACSNTNSTEMSSPIQVGSPTASTPTAFIGLHGSDGERRVDPTPLVCKVISPDSTETSTAVVDEKSRSMVAHLNKLAKMLQEKGTKVKPIDRSNCGQSKRRRTGYGGSFFKIDSFDEDFDSEDDDDDLGDFAYSSFSSLAKSRFNPSLSKSVPSDCDCGQPWRIVGGRHTCRYFGTFECQCGNVWTSAYCWKGEMQACRRCNKESLPSKTEKLDGRLPSVDSGGAHDSLRCAMCARLGYNCSNGF